VDILCTTNVSRPAQIMVVQGFQTTSSLCQLEVILASGTLRIEDVLGAVQETTNVALAVWDQTPRLATSVYHLRGLHVTVSQGIVLTYQCVMKMLSASRKEEFTIVSAIQLIMVTEFSVPMSMELLENWGKLLQLLWRSIWLTISLSMKMEAKCSISSHKLFNLNNIQCFTRVKYTNI